MDPIKENCNGVNQHLFFEVKKNQETRKEFPVSFAYYKNNFKASKDIFSSIHLCSAISFILLTHHIRNSFSLLSTTFYS